MHAIQKYSTAALLSAALAGQAGAATILWTGAANDDWHDHANWSTNGVPTLNDDVVIAGGRPGLGANGAVKTLTFNAGSGDTQIADTVSGGNATLQIWGGAVTHNAAAQQRINIGPQLTLITNTNFIVHGDRELWLLGGIGQGLAPVTLNKMGTGTLRVSNASATFTGPVNVLGGILRSEGGALGSGLVTVYGGGSLLHQGTMTNDLHLSGNGAGDNPTAGGGTFAGTTTLKSNVRLGGGTFNGLITDGAGAYRITKIGDGSLNLAADNAYDGGTVVERGTVSVRHAGGLGTGAVTVTSNEASVLLEFDTGAVANEFRLSTMGATLNDGSRGGAIRTWNGRTPTLSGDIRVEGFAALSVGHNGTLTLTGALLDDTPNVHTDGYLAKYGDGTLVVDVQTNALREMPAFDGVLVVTGPAAAGSAYFSARDGATLALTGGYTHAGNMSLWGAGHHGLGALRNLAGDNTITGVVSLTPVEDGEGEVTIGVDAGSSLTLAGIVGVSSPYQMGLRKTGQGTLVLDSEENRINLDFAIDAGTLSIGKDAHLGANPHNTITATGNARLLIRESMSTARTFNFTNAGIEAAAGATVGFHGIVNGATLRGPGAFHFANGATMANVTTLVGTNVSQSDNVYAANLTNMGNLANTSGTLTWSGGENKGRFDVHEAAATSYLLNSGRIHVHGGATLTNTGSDFHSAGGSRITVDQGAAVALGGYDLHLDGALLTNNGAITGGTVHVNYGSTVKGSGSFDNIAVSEGGVFSPGNSPGLTQTGDVTFAAGGTYLWEINDATGLPAVQYDHWIAEDLTITAGTTPNSRFTIRVATLLGNNANGPMANFDAEGSYQWTLLTADAITGFDADKFAIDLTGFANAYTHDFVLAQSGNSLVLGYNVGSVPEPASLVLAAIGAGLLLSRRQTRG